MNIRFHTFTLSIILLMMLNACGTTGPAPVVEPVVEPGLSAPIGIGEDILRDPSDRSLVEIEELANDMIGYQPDVALEVLRSLEYVPSGQLVVMIDSQIYTPEFTEWLELSLQVRNLLINGRPVKFEARKWADYHYGHAITRDNFPDLVARYGAMFPVPSQVAILLPTEGGLDAVAKAIRDCILSAYLEQPGDAGFTPAGRMVNQPSQPICRPGRMAPHRLLVHCASNPPVLWPTWMTWVYRCCCSTSFPAKNRLTLNKQPPDKKPV